MFRTHDYIAHCTDPEQKAVQRQSQHDAEAQNQQQQQQGQGSAWLDHSPCQRSALGPFDLSVKSPVPEVVGDATGSTNSQTTHNDLQKELQIRWGIWSQPERPCSRNEKDQSSGWFVPPQQFDPWP